MIEIRNIAVNDEVETNVYLADLQKFSAAVISDALDVVRNRMKEARENSDTVTAMNRGGVLPSDIQSLGEITETVVGPVSTVWAPDGTSLPLHLALLKQARNRIVVVATKHCKTTSYIGDIQALLAHRNHCRGLIIDGLVRDKTGILETSLPVFCSGTSPKRPNKVENGGINVPIEIGSVTIDPEDYVVADADGVVIVPRELVEAVIMAAKEKEAYDMARKGRVATFDFESIHSVDDYKKIVTEDVAKHLEPDENNQE